MQSKICLMPGYCSDVDCQQEQIVEGIRHVLSRTKSRFSGGITNILTVWNY
jgi:hypothetical protein